MLNKEQVEAINHFKGPALILAVPGAGKTTVLIHRTAKLIHEHGIHPKNILSITFSRASARDMRQRFYAEFKDLGVQANFSTIHSFCFGLIRHYSYVTKSKWELIEDSNSKFNKYDLLKELYFKFNNSLITEDKLESLINYIGYIKNMMISPDEFLRMGFPKINGFKDIYTHYENFKEENNLIDFDDMLTLAYNILLDCPPILKAYQNHYKFIQVDEGQDTSKIQLEIVKLLAKPDNNLVIVADDDQSIYGFRGAFPQGLFEFKEEYEKIKVFFMEENYRSSREIINISNLLISHNDLRFKKIIRPNFDFFAPVQLIKLDKISDQYSLILQDLRSKAINDSAVLFRNNISAIGLVDFFERNNISFSMNDKDLKFFNHWLIGDIINFLKFAEDTSNSDLYEKIYYKKKGYISKKQVQYTKKLWTDLSVFDKIMDFPGLQSFYVKNLRELKKDFNKLKTLKPQAAIDFIYYQLEYINYLRDRAKNFGLSFRNLEMVIFFLKRISKGTNNYEELIERINYLKNLCIESRDKDGIKLSTIHSAKGLEFNNVYIIDLIDGDFPSESSIEEFENGSSINIEEERRLFYVAITRAKQYLTLFTINRVLNTGVQPSRFLTDLTE